MFTYRMLGAFVAVTMVSVALSACAGSYETARMEAPPQPGMKQRCFTPPNPGRAVSPPTKCWWYWPKTRSPE